jgi:hypothetical protein
METILATFRDYYRKPAVRQRILEFLGGETPATATCEYITADGVAAPRRAPRRPDELFPNLDAGLDICRSLWDRESLIAHLDIEYVNFDFPAEAYLDPERAFGLQSPVVEAVMRVLGYCGIRPLHVLSGRGHHFVWRVRKDSRVFQALDRFGEGTWSEPCAVEGLEAEAVGGRLPRAFNGLGMVMEFLGRVVGELSGPACPIPVDLTAVEVEPSLRGREMVSIDLSEYGDPLGTRTVRVPFSGYLKPWQQTYAVGSNNLGRIGPIIFIPVDGIPIERAIAAMRDPVLAAECAEGVSAAIPECTEGTRLLVGAYEASPLRGFHRYFYSEAHDPPERWPSTYDRTPLDGLSMPVRTALLFPNDLLLRPSNLRAVALELTRLGWHPRHVAGLVRSKFEHDYGWGDRWRGYSPAMRADFYTRIFTGFGVDVAGFAGMVRAGRDLAWEAVPAAAGGVR